MRLAPKYFSQLVVVATGCLFCPSTGLAQRPLGTDVSGYQPSINWTTVKNAGVAFSWAKATESTTYVNPYFTSQMTGAKNVGIYTGAYHFARPSANPNLTGANSADSEAAFYWSVVSNYIKPVQGYLVPMLDWEDPKATNGAGFTVTQMSQWVNQWCNTISNLAKASGVTLKPVIYTGVWFSSPSSGLGGYPGLNSTVTGWPNWIATYNGQNPQSGGPSSSYPWSTWNLWQYADTNWSGGDSDVYNGTLAQFVLQFVIGGTNLPNITSQPLWRAVDSGGNVTLTAIASGTAPLRYQWNFSGAPITGATNNSYTLTNAQTANTGNYTLVVTNVGGSVTSNPSWLIVYPPQATIFADNFDANSSANWTYNRSSADNSATFSFDYSTLGIPSAPNSTNGSTRGLQMKANLTAAVAAAVSLSPSGQSFSGDYRLHFDAWINVNGPFPGGGVGSTEFLTSGLGTAGNRTQWTGSGATTDGYWFAVDGDGGVSATSTTSGDYQALSGTSLSSTSSGVYIAGTDTTVRDNLNTYYTTAIPGGQSAPAPQQTAYAQQTGSLATGSFGLAWHDVIISKRGNTVDWVVDGVRLATVPNATFTASNVFVGFWDFFPSLADNTAINFGLVDNVRVESPAVGPAFTLQPFAQTVKLGTNAMFAASATGLPSPNYQWRYNGTNISGATNSNYALAFVAATNTGNYSVLITNFMGSITSTNAALSLVAPSAAQFSSVNVSTGSVQISFSGDAYWTYTIETSTNLTSWSALTNLTSANGLFKFDVGSTTNSPQQFFRARVGP